MRMSNKEELDHFLGPCSMEYGGNLVKMFKDGDKSGSNMLDEKYIMNKMIPFWFMYQFSMEMVSKFPIKMATIVRDQETHMVVPSIFS